MKALNSSDYNVPDGNGIILASRLLKTPIPKRICGIELAEELMAASEAMGLRLFLYGGEEGVAVNAALKLCEKYPNLKIVGSQNGYAKDKSKVFEEIIKKKPDIVLVALGIPMQEKLIYQHLDKFNKGIFVGVGGSFDTISGSKKRAPKIFIKLNLEWFYRIACEPKRIKRFYDSNIKFIFRALKKENKIS
jgi:N-acetylglucosaminyldiphosphoundecaprenol N-acetyl-beta-D-mannosaminyltransferase